MNKKNDTLEDISKHSNCIDLYSKTSLELSKSISFDLPTILINHYFIEDNVTFLDNTRSQKDTLKYNSTVFGKYSKQFDSYEVPVAYADEVYGIDLLSINNIRIFSNEEYFEDWISLSYLRSQYDDYNCQKIIFKDTRSDND